MQRTLRSLIALSVFTFPGMAAADPIPVSYEIGAYGAAGYSASWLHGSTGCSGTGPSGGTLYMCGSVSSTTGSITGTYNHGIFSISGGSLIIGGVEFDILSGQLGGAFTYGAGANTSSWFIEVDGLGTFFFEGLDMGSGRPNVLDINELILWGQNLDAYLCEPGDTACSRYGVDLYGRMVAVPEPGTLALLGVGLLGMGLMQRRKRAYASNT